ncbi:hypothetical protein EYF80_057173 [Liparis tanakae]|uniref:Uncharacterized protein n=1 Tax=Liparis tanakae TaxID=230148 RepID=A0A4Z2EWD0_9TELE|nr:hypothetical protein EYF80_057173 [Liparis tanakae]
MSSLASGAPYAATCWRLSLGHRREDAGRRGGRREERRTQGGEEDRLLLRCVGSSHKVGPRGVLSVRASTRLLARLPVDDSAPEG